MQPEISIVIPLYNEEESIPALYAALIDALDIVARSYEIIIVDDGSSDGSFPLLRQIAQQDARVRLIRLRRNFGQTAAFAAGFDTARGEVIITLDADLQNDPADIPKLMAKFDEGYDVVSGWRVDRKDRFLDRRLPSILANWLISHMTAVRLHDYGCSLKAYRRDVIQHVRLYGELHRFLPALAAQVGAAVVEVPVNHHARQFGRSKYGIGRTVHVMLDLITVWFLNSYATRPIHVFGMGGLLSALSGVGISVYLTFRKFAIGEDIGGRPLLILAVLLILVGVQLVTMGLIGELIIRTYHESQGKPIYVVREVMDSSEEPILAPI